MNWLYGETVVYDKADLQARANSSLRKSTNTGTKGFSFHTCYHKTDWFCPYSQLSCSNWMKVTLYCFKCGCKKSAKVHKQRRHKVPFKGTHTHRHPPSHGHHPPGKNTFSIYSYECGCLVLYFLLSSLWLSHVWEVILWDFWFMPSSAFATGCYCWFWWNILISM